MLRSLVEQMPGVAWTDGVDGSDRTGGRIYIAPQVAQLLGYTPDGADGRAAVLRAAGPPGRPRTAILALAERCVRRGEPWLSELPHRCARRRVLWLRSRGNLGHDDRGRPLLHGMWVDITTERERTDAASEDSAERRDR